MREQRERLIELLMKMLIKNKNTGEVTYLSEIEAAAIANYLLDNGVIVPPLKVGTKVAVIESQTSNGKNLYVFEDRIAQYRICESCVLMCFDHHISVPHWNWQNVFSGENAREEAEKALEGMK